MTQSDAYCPLRSNSLIIRKIQGIFVIWGVSGPPCSRISFIFDHATGDSHNWIGAASMTSHLKCPLVELAVGDD